MIHEWILFLKAHGSVYWHMQSIMAHKEVYIGCVIGSAVLLKLSPGILKLPALVLAFFSPYIYFTYFAQ